MASEGASTSEAVGGMSPAVSWAPGNYGVAQRYPAAPAITSYDDDDSPLPPPRKRTPASQKKSKSRTPDSRGRSALCLSTKERPKDWQNPPEVTQTPGDEKEQASDSPAVRKEKAVAQSSNPGSTELQRELNAGKGGTEPEEMVKEDPLCYPADEAATADAKPDDPNEPPSNVEQMHEAESNGHEKDQETGSALEPGMERVSSGAGGQLKLEELESLPGASEAEVGTPRAGEDRTREEAVRDKMLQWSTKKGEKGGPAENLDPNTQSAVNAKIKYWETLAEQTRAEREVAAERDSFLASSRASLLAASRLSLLPADACGASMLLQSALEEEPAMTPSPAQGGGADAEHGSVLSPAQRRVSAALAAHGAALDDLSAALNTAPARDCGGGMAADGSEEGAVAPAQDDGGTAASPEAREEALGGAAPEMAVSSDTSGSDDGAEGDHKQELLPGHAVGAVEAEGGAGGEQDGGRSDGATRGLVAEEDACSQHEVEGQAAEHGEKREPTVLDAVVDAKDEEGKGGDEGVTHPGLGEEVAPEEGKEEEEVAPEESREQEEEVAPQESEKQGEGVAPEEGKEEEEVAPEEPEEQVEGVAPQESEEQTAAAVDGRAPNAHSLPAPAPAHAPAPAPDGDGGAAMTPGTRRRAVFLAALEAETPESAAGAAGADAAEQGASAAGSDSSAEAAVEAGAAAEEADAAAEEAGAEQAVAKTPPRPPASLFASIYASLQDSSKVRRPRAPAHPRNRARASAHPRGAHCKAGR